MPAKIIGVAKQPEFQILLCLAAFGVFTWPFVSFPNMSEPLFVFLFIYGAWALFIASIFLVTQSVDKVPAKEAQGAQRDSH